MLSVTGDDASLESIGPQVPSLGSRDYGEPFAAIFARYNNDFYAVDPHLFSPAEVVFQNVETGRCMPSAALIRRYSRVPSTRESRLLEPEICDP